MEMPIKPAIWNDWSQSGLDVQDWDGGNVESDAPRLSIWESFVIALIVLLMLGCCIPVMVYDWAHGGGRRG
jgi:hypothetical protein